MLKIKPVPKKDLVNTHFYCKRATIDFLDQIAEENGIGRGKVVDHMVEQIVFEQAEEVDDE